jgi:pilus assembly protein CpaE
VLGVKIVQLYYAKLCDRFVQAQKRSIMGDKIRLLIVDDLSTTRETVVKLLQFAPNIEVVAEAGTGRQAIDQARKHQPDVILMDINMPDMDGITASQQITRALPATQIIIMSVQSDTDYIRKAMLAGARDFLSKPFSLDELLTAVNTAYERRQTMPAVAAAPAPVIGATAAGPVTVVARPAPGASRIVAVFSPKGGSGCTTVAVNVAVSLARSGHETALVDASFQFGDVGLMLNLKNPATILDLVDRQGDVDPELISSILATHRSGVKVLLAPPRPEMAELITIDKVKAILELLRHQYEYVIVDTSVYLSDMNLAILDLADEILLVTPPNLPGIKNASRFLDLTTELEYVPDKVRLVVNGVSDRRTITIKDIASALKRPVELSVPDDVAAEAAADQGEPLVEGPAQRRPISVALRRVAERLAAPPGEEAGGRQTEGGQSSFFGRLFGRT